VGIGGEKGLLVEFSSGQDQRLLTQWIGVVLPHVRDTPRRPSTYTHARRIPRPILKITLLRMTDTQSHSLQLPRLIHVFTPPHRIWMSPDRLILFSKKCIGIKLIRMQRPPIVVFHTLPRHWMVATDWDLGEHVVFLNASEDVVRWDIGGSGECRIVAEGVHDPFACGEPCVYEC
jgi:hypothetical protein